VVTIAIKNQKLARSGGFSCTLCEEVLESSDLLTHHMATTHAFRSNLNHSSSNLGPGTDSQGNAPRPISEKSHSASSNREVSERKVDLRRGNTSGLSPVVFKMEDSEPGRFTPLRGVKREREDDVVESMMRRPPNSFLVENHSSFGGGVQCLGVERKSRAMVECVDGESYEQTRKVRRKDSAKGAEKVPRPEPCILTEVYPSSPSSPSFGMVDDEEYASDQDLSMDKLPTRRPDEKSGFRRAAVSKNKKAVPHTYVIGPNFKRRVFEYCCKICGITCVGSHMLANHMGRVHPKKNKK